eukprot:SAG11_NODE_25979_length_351_cov_0.825397_1_plen_29_part_10
MLYGRSLCDDRVGAHDDGAGGPWVSALLE